MTAEKLSEIDISQMEQEAAELLALSGHCAQAAFSVLNDHFELDGASTLKALTPLPGIGLRGDVCGSVIGGLMALGLVFGRDDLTDLNGFRRSLPPARAFCRQFEAQYGSLKCSCILERELGQSFDLAKKQEFLEYLNCGGQDSCSRVVQTGVRLAAEMVLRAWEEDGPPSGDPDPGVMLTV